MNKDSKQMIDKESQRVIGIDIGDVKSHICELDKNTGEVVKRATLRTEMAALLGYFSARAKSLIILEVGTHSPWMSRLLAQLGHQVIVGNARELRLIYSSKRKNDRLDAEKLARLGRLDQNLICQVKHRSQDKQADLAVIRAREELIKVRQQLVNHLRGVLKSYGVKPPACYPAGFHKKVLAHIPQALAAALLPVIESLKSIQQQLSCLDKRIAQLCQHSYDETELLTRIKGVGYLIALHFVLCLDEPARFSSSRAVGAYLGLVPGQHQSGASNPRLGISRQGDPLLRRHLVQAANYILGHFGEDCDLRRSALARLETGEKRKKLIVAVARKLAVLMHHLWLTGTVYEPLYQSGKASGQAKAVAMAA